MSRAVDGKVNTQLRKRRVNAAAIQAGNVFLCGGDMKETSAVGVMSISTFL